MTKKIRDGKKALKAGIFYVISRVLVRGVIYFTTPVFTRIMTTEEFGEVQTFSTWYSFFIIIFTLNLGYGVGRAKYDFPNKIDDYIGSMQVLALSFSVVICTISMLWLPRVAVLLGISEKAVVLLMIYLIASIPISFYLDGCVYCYKYKQNLFIAWYIALSTVVLSLILILFYSWDNAFSRMLGITLPSVLLAALIIGKAIKAGILRYNYSYWKYGLKLSMPLILHTLSLTVLGQADRIFIARICGKSEVAFYSLAYSIGSLVSVIMEGLNGAWLPWFHDNLYYHKVDKIRYNANRLSVFVCFISLGLIGIAPEAIIVFGGNVYHESLYCIVPIVIGVLCQFFYGHYVNIEMHKKKTIYISVATLMSSIINICLNAIFIPQFGYIAAAYTTLASYFFLMVFHFAITKVVLKISVYNNKSLFGMLMLAMVIGIIIMNTYSNVIVRYIIIMMVFILFFVYFREDVISIINGILHK